MKSPTRWTRTHFWRYFPWEGMKTVIIDDKSYFYYVNPIKFGDNMLKNMYYVLTYNKCWNKNKTDDIVWRLGKEGQGGWLMLNDPSTPLGSSGRRWEMDVQVVFQRIQNVNANKLLWQWLGERSNNHNYIDICERLGGFTDSFVIPWKWCFLQIMFKKGPKKCSRNGNQINVGRFQRHLYIEIHTDLIF